MTLSPEKQIGFSGESAFLFYFVLRASLQNPKRGFIALKKSSKPFRIVRPPQKVIDGNVKIIG